MRHACIVHISHTAASGRLRPSTKILHVCLNSDDFSLLCSVVVVVLLNFFHAFLFFEIFLFCNLFFFFWYFFLFFVVDFYIAFKFFDDFLVVFVFSYTLLCHRRCISCTLRFGYCCIFIYIHIFLNNTFQNW